MEKLRHYGGWLIQIAIGIAIGITLAMKLDVDQTAWLNLIATVLGAALTVLGAIVVVDHQQHSGERQVRQLLADHLNAVDGVFLALSDHLEDRPESKGEVRMLLQVGERQARRLRRALKFTTPTTARMVSAFQIAEDLDFPWSLWSDPGQFAHVQARRRDALAAGREDIATALRFLDAKSTSHAVAPSRPPTKA